MTPRPTPPLATPTLMPYPSDPTVVDLSSFAAVVEPSWIPILLVAVFAICVIIYLRRK